MFPPVSCFKLVVYIDFLHRKMPGSGGWGNRFEMPRGLSTCAD